ARDLPRRDGPPPDQSGLGPAPATPPPAALQIVWRPSCCSLSGGCGRERAEEAGRTLNQDGVSQQAEDIRLSQRAMTPSDSAVPCVGPGTRVAVPRWESPCEGSSGTGSPQQRPG
uniref:Uncharacterized protein n=1 Tax=Coturnix japonica TaxID=93934 RepID=A0A8C2YBY0_COTJA